MNRRALLAGFTPALALARQALADAGAPASRLGLCTFSSHQHWKAAKEGAPGVLFTDAIGFYRHARQLGADGVQAPVTGKDEAFARELRALVDQDGGYFEGDILLPALDGDWDGFQREIRLAKLAGATLARCYLTGSRRYEAFPDPDAYDTFLSHSRQRLAKAATIVESERFLLAVENHKDQDAADLAAMVRGIGSDRLGVTYDTGNNLSLLEQPETTLGQLAPLALTVHLKDMGVRPKEDGFWLSEVPFGQGALDLKQIVAALAKARPGIIFNVEMATRNPLDIPCLSDAYWKSHRHPDRTAADRMMEWVRARPLRTEPPRVSGVPLDRVLAAEEENNRLCLARRADLLP